MEMQALIEEITRLLAKIKSGEAALDELEAFAAATGQLNERAIILRYKAIEAQIYGNPVAELISESPASAQEIKPVIEAQEGEESLQKIASDNDSWSEEEPSFDLFGIDSEVEERAETPKTEIIAEKETNFWEEKEEIPAIDEEPIARVVEPVRPAEEVKETIQEPTFTAPVEQTHDLHPIYGKLNSNDGTLAARLMSVRLDTLKGAFGFNERLQIIQELFNGSNDEFNNLIEQLETIPSKEQARSLVSSYANKYQWDVDSQLAIELVQKVERKYA